jgi:hypothetical protein
LTGEQVKALLDSGLPTEDYETCASIRNFFAAKKQQLLTAVIVARPYNLDNNNFN